MEITELIKSIFAITKGINNIELNSEVMELQQLIFDNLEEIRRLKQENNELKKKQDFEDRIERYEQPYFTLKGENPNIRYCTTCWGASGIKIQLDCSGDGTFNCPNCKYYGEYDTQLFSEYQKRILEINYEDC